jgi:hypothetical protein
MVDECTSSRALTRDLRLAALIRERDFYTGKIQELQEVCLCGNPLACYSFILNHSNLATGIPSIISPNICVITVNVNLQGGCVQVCTKLSIVRVAPLGDEW